jgi:hypothetical protein
VIARALVRAVIVAVALACVAPSPARSGAPPEAVVAQLAQKMPEASAREIGRVLADARAKGLPTGPIEATAREGVARGVAPDRIVAAVHAKEAALASARQALGVGSTEADLVAGATALGAGIAADSLAKLRSLRPGSAVVPLVVMSDLVARGAPGTVASSAVLRAARAGVRDPELLRLRERIAGDIGSGATPVDAILLRTRSFIPTTATEPPSRGTPTPPKPKLQPGDGP